MSILKKLSINKELEKEMEKLSLVGIPFWGVV